MTRKRTAADKANQGAYEARKLAAGEHIQINVKLKAAADVADMEALRGRFDKMTDAGIARLALRELAAKANRK